MSLPHGLADLANMMVCVLSCTGMSDYSDWADAIRDLLRFLDFDTDAHILTDHRPTVGAKVRDNKGNEVLDVDGKPVLYTDADVKTWNDQDRAVHMLIQLKQAAVPRRYTKKAETARVAWVALQQIYAPKSNASDMRYVTMLFTTKAQEGDDIEVHIDKMLSIHDEITDVNNFVPDALFASAILGSLPPSYDPIVQAYGQQQRDTLKSREIIQRVIQHHALLAQKMNANAQS